MDTPDTTPSSTFDDGGIIWSHTVPDEDCDKGGAQAEEEPAAQAGKAPSVNAVSFVPNPSAAAFVPNFSAAAFVPAAAQQPAPVAAAPAAEDIILEADDDL